MLTGNLPLKKLLFLILSGVFLVNLVYTQEFRFQNLKGRFSVGIVYPISNNISGEPYNLKFRFFPSNLLSASFELNKGFRLSYVVTQRFLGRGDFTRVGSIVYQNDWAHSLLFSKKFIPKVGIEDFQFYVGVGPEYRSGILHYISLPPDTVNSYSFKSLHFLGDWGITYCISAEKTIKNHLVFSMAVQHSFYFFLEEKSLASDNNAPFFRNTIRVMPGLSFKF